jgi:hypothetical protein
MFLFTTPTGRDPAPAASLPANTPVVDAIRQGAARTGVGFDYLLSTAQRESALDPKAQARGSSASGLFQFVEQTWLGMVKSEGGKAGLTDYARAISTRQDGTYAVDDPSLRRAILDLRQDPAVASVMAGALTQKNREVLTSGLGREPTGGELYVAHFLGAAGAAELVKTAASNPSRPIASDFPDAAAANRSIFFDPQGRPRGAGEVYALLTRSQAASSGATFAPAFAPDRPVAFARQDGPAFHGLFQTDGRTGPISDSVAKLWRSSRADAGVQVAALNYFPNSAGGSVRSPQEAPADEAPRTVVMPLPPRRPDNPTRAPLDLSAFMKAHRA